MTHARRAGDVPPCAASCIPLELSDLDETSVALFRAFGRALRLHRQFMVKRLGASDVHPGQAACLSVLAHHDGIAQRDLAAAMHIAPPTLSRMLRSLEEKGLVERRDDRSDQRLLRVHLSPEGRAVGQTMSAALADHIPAALAALSRDERLELIRLLDKLSASISRSLELGCAAEAAAHPASSAADEELT